MRHLRKRIFVSGPVRLPYEKKRPKLFVSPWQLCTHLKDLQITIKRVSLITLDIGRPVDQNA